MKKKDPEIQLNFDETNEDNPVKNNINENNTLGADINRKKTAMSGLILFILTLTGIATIIACISFFMGNNDKNILSFQHTIDTENKIITVQNGYALTKELVNDKQKFVVRKSNTEYTILPINTSLASEISLSPDSSKIAYISREKDISLGILILNNLQVKGFINYTLDMMSDKEPFQLAFAGKSICPWTQIKWSSNSNRFAFFFCDISSQSSYLTIVKANPIDIIWFGKKNNSLTKRSLDWLDANNILISYNGSSISTEVVDVSEIIKEGN
jgi:hypothetical protein